MSEIQFVNNCRSIAQKAMNDIDPNLTGKYIELISFLEEFPEAASKLKGKNAPVVGSEEYIYRSAQLFEQSRLPRTPTKPSTIPDEMVSVVLQYFFDVKREQLERIKEEHLLSMGAENIVGDLLERYLASILEPYGWVWCSGTFVRAVDFIKYDENKKSWKLLQVKNRDNTENSSSSAIRNGTQIIKWFRTFSRKVGSNWENFPDEVCNRNLSESDFRKFVIEYLTKLKR